MSSQFFYAFALGLLLAYTYFYTGTLKAPAVLHMLFNFYGSSIMMLLPETARCLCCMPLSWPVLTVAGVTMLGSRLEKAGVGRTVLPCLRCGQSSLILG